MTTLFYLEYQLSSGKIPTRILIKFSHPMVHLTFTFCTFIMTRTTSWYNTTPSSFRRWCKSPLCWMVIEVNPKRNPRTSALLTLVTWDDFALVLASAKRLFQESSLKSLHYNNNTNCGMALASCICIMSNLETHAFIPTLYTNPTDIVLLENAKDRLSLLWWFSASCNFNIVLPNTFDVTITQRVEL